MTHPLVRTGRRYVIGGAAFALFGSMFSLFFGVGAVPAIFACLGGGFLIWNGRALMTSGVALPILQESIALITKGKLDEAERVTSTLPPRATRRPMIARAVTVQRALIALMRGDAAAAEAIATESIALPSGLFTSDWDGVYRSEARATRALARAAQGNSAGALEDAAAIEASPYTLSSALARAALTRAILHARSGDKAALGAHLAAHGSLILEHVMPRERSLTRALRAMARAPGKSAYREAARPSEEDTEEGRVRDWISKVAPDAAGFAPREVYVEAPEAAAPRADPEAMRAIASARAAAKPSKSRVLKRTIALWIALVVMFLGIWQFLTPAERVAPVEEALPPEPAAPMFTTFSLALLGGAVAFVTAFLAWWIRRHRHRQRRFFAADRDLALGRTEAGRAELFLLATTNQPALAASARLRLAVLDNKEGRFADAVTQADLGLGLSNQGPTTKALTNDIIAPSLLEERALALAATDRFAEAETELAHLASGFPTFALMERALFRVRLVTAVRRGDLAAAASIALSRKPEMPLDLKIDLLADVALASSDHPMSADERERIATELRAMPAANAWVTQVAGNLSRLRVATPAVEERLEEDEDEVDAQPVQALTRS